MADEGPTAEELAKAKAYLKGSYALTLDTSTKIAAQLAADPARQSRHRLHREAQRPDRRRDDRGRQARRQAAARRRHAGDGRRPAEGPRKLRAVPTCSRCTTGCALAPQYGTASRCALHAIHRQRAGRDRRPARRRRRRRSPTRSTAPRPRSPGCARGMPTAPCRCCACRRSATTSPPSATPRRGCATAPATSCFSAPAARASAARRWRSSPATACRASAPCASRRACISWTISIRDTFGDAARAAAARDHAASSRSRNPAAPARR